MVLNEMLNKEQAWATTDSREVELRVRSGERPPEPVVGDTEKELVLLQLMRCCLDQEPRNRPQMQTTDQALLTLVDQME